VFSNSAAQAADDDVRFGANRAGADATSTNIAPESDIPLVPFCQIYCLSFCHCRQLSPPNLCVVNGYFVRFEIIK
jgi:hypothetical protein